MTTTGAAIQRGANPYKTATLALVRAALAAVGAAPAPRALDFGSGDGWYAASFEASGLARQVVGVDVLARPGAFHPAELYDGVRLPFADREFPLVYAFDVLHHCPDPEASLREMLRCAGDRVVIKDHSYRSVAGKLALALLDELGNRRFGVPSIYKYQRGFAWFPLLEAAGFTLEKLIHPAPCETRPLLRLGNRLQFIGIWRRA
jgi:SAM-dependent methyltransferase